jgi:hypothetical protein
VENDTAINTMLMMRTMQKHVPPTAKCHVSGTAMLQTKRQQKAQIQWTLKVGWTSNGERELTVGFF